MPAYFFKIASSHLFDGVVRCIKYDGEEKDSDWSIPASPNVYFFIPMHLSFVVLLIVALICNAIDWIAQLKNFFFKKMLSLPSFYPNVFSWHLCKHTVASSFFHHPGNSNMCIFQTLILMLWHTPHFQRVSSCNFRDTSAAFKLTLPKRVTL